MRKEIAAVCDEVKELLLKKNESYGNSAGDPVRIFSKVNAIEQINVRIDDKISRIARGNDYGGEDTELDLIGYLVLKRVVLRESMKGSSYMMPDIDKAYKIAAREDSK